MGLDQRGATETRDSFTIHVCVNVELTSFLFLVLLFLSLAVDADSSSFRQITSFIQYNLRLNVEVSRNFPKRVSHGNNWIREIAWTISTYVGTVDLLSKFVYLFQDPIRAPNRMMAKYEKGNYATRIQYVVLCFSSYFQVTTKR